MLGIGTGKKSMLEKLTIDDCIKFLQLGVDLLTAFKEVQNRSASLPNSSVSVVTHE